MVTGVTFHFPVQTYGIFLRIHFPFSNFAELQLDLLAKPSHAYSEQQREFALTLHFYGPKAVFFQIIDRLFDLLNSRSPIAKGSKEPCTQDNWECRRDFLLQAKEYLLGLRRADGTPLSQTRRSVTVVLIRLFYFLLPYNQGVVISCCHIIKVL